MSYEGSSQRGTEQRTVNVALKTRHIARCLRACFLCRRCRRVGEVERERLVVDSDVVEHNWARRLAGLWSRELKSLISSSLQVGFRPPHPAVIKPIAVHRR